MHPSEDGLAAPVAMVSRAAESTLHAPVSSVGDDNILEEFNFAGLIIGKLYFMFSFLLDRFYMNILGPSLSLHVREQVDFASRSEHGCQGEEEESRGKSEDVRKQKGED
jgi:hypothetical protein